MKKGLTSARAFWGILFLLSILLWLTSGYGAQGEAVILELEGPINPGTAAFLSRGIERAKEGNASLVIVRLDTPGGLASSMRSMVKSIVNSSIPVVVYVSPSGSGAASAGVLVTVAAHVAAMAPGTNIGAAHPVGAGGKDIDKTMSDKVVNDMVSYARSISKEKGRNADWVEKAIRESVSITAEEALENGVIDLIATDVDDLLRKLDGREVHLQKAKTTLSTKGIAVRYQQPGFRDKILKTISDPNIAYILMMIGLAGLYFELSHPGAIFPGVIGGISLVLAFYAFQALPVNYAGLLLIGLGVLFFIAEVKVASFGLLAFAGIISLTLGSIMLFEDLSVSLRLIAPTVIFIGGFFVVVSMLALRAFRSKPKLGSEGIVGEVGTVRKKIDPEGLVFVHGEYWKAVSTDRIEEGERARVESVDGLVLKVRKASDGHP